MLVELLQVRNLRCYSTVSLPCAPGLNVLFGSNGAGKTTLLEAICVGAWGKTLNSPDAALLRLGTRHYWVRIDARSDLGVPYWVEVEYSPDRGKHIRSAHGSSLSPRELVGTIPIVFLAPTTKEITMGAPRERRRFLDMVLAQSSRPYLELLLAHRRILQQRNALLQRQPSDPNFSFQWKSWTKQFVRISAEIVWWRWRFLHEFEPLVQAAFQQIAPETLKLSYIPDSIPPECLEQGTEAIAAHLYQHSSKLESEEFRRGTTLFGPQKDELLFLLNGQLAREGASQGQHKSIVLSLKLAELAYLRQQCGKLPIVLLDDVFAELDRQRAREVLATLEKLAAQCFVTVTEPERVPESMNHHFYWVHVEAGTVHPLPHSKDTEGNSKL